MIILLILCCTKAYECYYTSMVEKISPKVKEVFHVLRGRIKTMPVGVPLPTFSELKGVLNVGQLTIQRAYDMLEVQGYIDRKVGKGVFVADRTQTGEFAIVILPEMLGPPASPYYALTCNALVEMVHERRPSTNIKMHFGKVDAINHQFIPPQDLIHPNIAAKLRGVFSFHPLCEEGHEEVGQELSRLGVPVITMGEKGRLSGDYSVAFDSEDSVRQYLTALAQAGCKTIGILGKVSFGNKTTFPWIKPDLEAAKSLGLELRPEWIPISKCLSEITDKIGYEQFLQLWKRNEKPDGIIVLDDVVCRGVLRGCLQLGVDLPGDIQLITHANKRVELPYHKSITRLEFDAEEQARHAVDIARNLLQGNTVEVRKILVPGKLILGDTTRPVRPVTN